MVKKAVKAVRLRRTVEEVAAGRGAKYLDETLSGWAAKIDLRTLRMASPNVCILGQCFGNFFEQLRKLHNGEAFSDTAKTWAVHHGFNAQMTSKGQAVGGSYERLAFAWAPLVAVRQIGRQVYE